MKLCGVRLEDETEDILQHIVSYIKLMHQVCGISVFIFVNLKSFFVQKDIDQIYTEAAYEHVIIVDLESGDNYKKVDTEKYMIFDKDLCIIRVN